MQARATIAVLLLTILSAGSANAAPSAELAKRCLRYAYTVYPYKRPGSVRGTGDRQAYFQDCLARDGNVPVPAPANARN